MNIQQVEELTGVTKQNIRFYEKQGLLSPKRNGTNAYRDYGEAEIHDIKVIKLLRKLDMPIAEIKKVLERTIPFGAVVQCRILEDEGTSQKGNVDKRYEILQWIYRILPVLILFFLCFYAMGRAGVTNIGIQLLSAIAETSMIVASWRLIIHVK